MPELNEDSGHVDPGGMPGGMPTKVMLTQAECQPRSCRPRKDSGRIDPVMSQQCSAHCHSPERHITSKSEKIVYMCLCTARSIWRVVYH